MALTQTHIDALEKALASGALRVDFPDGGSVTYRSASELLAGLNYASSVVFPVADRPSQSYVTVSKD